MDARGRGGAGAGVPPKKAERAGAIDRALDATETRERQEHWRLSTSRRRARGAAGDRRRAGAEGEGRAADEQAGMRRRRAPSTHWAWRRGKARIFDGTSPVPPRAAAEARADAAAPAVAALPGWARRPAPEERRPTRPLAPSSLGEDKVAEAPPNPAMREAAARGRMMHALLSGFPAGAPSSSAGRRCAGSPSAGWRMPRMSWRRCSDPRRSGAHPAVRSGGAGRDADQRDAARRAGDRGDGRPAAGRGRCRPAGRL
ncbi:hypothetical protein AB5I41_02845 [Sphingomonas sp. MMS24-JH45]